MATEHRLSAQIHKGRYIQSSDPGAVGAGVEWLDTTTTPPIHKKRNAGDSGWDTILDQQVIALTTGATFTGDVVVPDEAYDATGWNGNNEVPTKNAVRDKIETLAPLASPALTGTPTAPTPSPADNSTKIATTAYVDDAVSGASGALADGDYGDITVSGSGTVMNIDAGVVTGTEIASSVALAGSPTTTTQSANDNSTKIATTAYVDNAVSGGTNNPVLNDRDAQWNVPGSPNAMDDEFDGSSSATWTDINTPTYSIVNNALMFTVTNTDAKKLRVQTAPSTPYCVVTALTHYQASGGAGTPGIWFRQSSTGKLYVYMVNTLGDVAVHHYSGPGSSTFVATDISDFSSQIRDRHIWLAAADDGTNLKFYYSPDGIGWILLDVRARGAYMTGGPDQVGIGSNGGSGPHDVRFHHFRVTAASAP